MTKYTKISTGAALITMATLIMGLLGPIPFAAKEANGCEANECELELTKTDSVDPVNPGDELIYYLTLENVGTANCTGTGVRIKDFFDQSTTYVSSSKSPESITSEYIKWNVGTLYPEDVENINLTVLVSEDAECDSVLINKVKFWSTQTDWSDYVIEETTVECLEESYCGDGNLDQGEDCEVGHECCGEHYTCNLQTCICEYVPYCGDGNVDQGEECDDGSEGSETCTSECTIIGEGPRCGDETVDEGEECDDGNTQDGDGCSAICTIEHECEIDADCDELDEDYCEGTVIMHDEGVCNQSFECEVETTPGLDCDDGLYCNGQETCSNANCVAGTAIDCSTYDLNSIETCGFDPDNNIFTWDFFAGFLSDCDEETDSCTSGTVELEHSCDIENCDAECEDDEDCEEGGYCNSLCVCEYEEDEPECGDGVVNEGEECDDGNVEDGDGCSSTCIIEDTPPEPYCGDGNLDEGEECDDGNNVDEGCDPACESSCSYCSATCALITLTGGSCGRGGNGGGGGGGSTPRYPRLIIDKSVAEEFTNPDTTINYTVVVRNTGMAAANNVLLADILPKGFTYKETGLSTRDWDLDDISHKSEKTITYQVIIGEGVLAGNYVNTATVKANNLSPVSDDAVIEIRIPVVLGEMTPEVLGEMTKLPETGATPLMNILWVIAVITFISSITVLIKVVPINLSNGNKKSFGNFAY